ncbi:S1 family peptidase [Streptomyces sp. WAC05374]|uniref:S1 family peptidase n=1 Tax=Streptomyces sp. WAC05374 TaxID=2487420 RepID=UPI000F863346|nr:S1 family peptidase [Streptomyces sp. WAC05374]RST18639.1 S1 family peptidase [Streptomyces sp. WAC05374]TDF40708.1 S1 family peptidase [Streptomyces sp. WAC05374]TDF49384.1 S1 family peptidase [Streptomyces sp. WAC05374]TDF49923.1 S1 family peptidase [Streptomyces sp. WAC05374]
MKHRRIPTRRAAIAGGAAVALLGAGVTFQTANASEEAPRFTVKTLSAPAAGTLAATLDRTLGGDAAGAYYDATSRTLVVNVVDEAAARSVREAGGKARLVEHTLSELAGAGRTLKNRATIPGTSWAVDPVSNKVVVTADRTVKGAALDKLTQVVKGLGSKAELKRTAGEFRPFIAGGDAIHSGGGRCSLGFNVVKDGQPHFITAGHCGETGSEWSDSQGGAAVGTMVDSQFPGNDFALVKYAGDTAHPSEVNLYGGGTQAITKAGEATVGMKVTRSGSTTQVHDGEVTGLNATVNYGNGQVVEGLIQTNVCAEPGDSGGSLFSGDTAVGLTSGGSGDCSSGGETFFQPVTEALSTFGAQIG